MSSPNLDEMVTTTLRNRTGVPADNMSKNSMIWKRLNSKGKIKPVSGGRTIVQEVEYAENSSGQWYSGNEPLNIGPSTVLSAAEFNYAQYAIAVVITGLEELQNSGSKETVIDLLDARISNAEKTAVNAMAAGAWSDGTGDGGKQLGGLQSLVAATPSTGTVGGIDASAWSFWRNVSKDASADFGVTLGVSNIESCMDQVWMPLSRNNERPDLILSDNNVWRFYKESLTAIQRISSDNTAQVGFQSLKYMDADYVFDGGFSGSAPANSMFMLNTDYVFLRPHSKRNLVPLNPSQRAAIDQDAIVRIIAWAGQMTISNRSLQGYLQA